MKRITNDELQEIVQKCIDKKHFKKAIELHQGRRLAGFTISKSKAKSMYNLTDKDIKNIRFLEVDNPHYKCAPKMKLYLQKELEYKFSKAVRREQKIDELLINKN